jgi:hypothetical protein
VAARSGRVRLVLDGPPPTRPQALAAAVAEGLRTRGRAAVVVDAEDYRDAYVTLPADGVVVLAGGLLLGHGLPVDLAVHLRMSPAALARRLPGDEAWTLPAYARYDSESAPADAADLLVLADHPDRPAVRRR